MWTDAATPDEGVTQVADLFRDASGYESRSVWNVPGHVNIISKHVGYNGGPYVPIALPHRAYVTSSPREDRTIRLISSQTREVIDVLDLNVIDSKGIPDEIINHWTAYLTNVAWAFGQAGYGPLPGSDAALRSCALLGDGLSSSAMLECATAVALDEVCSLGLASTIETPNDEGRKVLVGATRTAENQMAGVNMGDLDQTASLCCHKGRALALDCRDMSTRQASFDLNAIGLELLVINTRTKHSLADGRYGSRRADYEESARILGVGQFIEVEDPGEATAALGNECLTVHTRHITPEIACMRAFIKPLSKGLLDGMRLAVTGALLNDSYGPLRDDYGVSCKELDVAVKAARAAGTHGACMTGGGFGGSAIALVDAHAVEGMV